MKRAINLIFLTYFVALFISLFLPTPKDNWFYVERFKKVALNPSKDGFILIGKRCYEFRFQKAPQQIFLSSYTIFIANPLYLKQDGTVYSLAKSSTPSIDIPISLENDKGKYFHTIAVGKRVKCENFKALYYRLPDYGIFIYYEPSWWERVIYFFYKPIDFIIRGVLFVLYLIIYYFQVSK